MWVCQEKRQAALLLKYEHGLLFKDEGGSTRTIVPCGTGICPYLRDSLLCDYSAAVTGFDIDKSNGGGLTALRMCSQ